MVRSSDHNWSNVDRKADTYHKMGKIPYTVIFMPGVTEYSKWMKFTNDENLKPRILSMEHITHARKFLSENLYTVNSL